MDGEYFTSSEYRLRLHLLSNSQGKVHTFNHDIDHHVFERYMIRHFNAQLCEYISAWVHSAALTSNRWQYLNLKHFGSTIDLEMLSGYTSHYELVKDFFQGEKGNVNTLRSAI